MPYRPDPASPFAPGPPPARWPAFWCAHPAAHRGESGVYHFRRSFELATVPLNFRVRVSADNRYHLYVNGKPVGEGPARGDLGHWRYETFDLAPYLKPGRNVIAAVTWYLIPELAPMAQFSYQPGFLMCGEAGDEAAQAVNTPTAWRCSVNKAYDFSSIDWRVMPAYFAIGSGEHIDATKYPWGWEQPDFDDSNWLEPYKIVQGSERGTRDSPSQWLLVPNLLPSMEATPQPVTKVVRVEGLSGEARALSADSPITVPAHAKAKILLDNGVLTTGYPELAVEGGRGAKLAMRYAEALYGGEKHDRKANRNQVEGMVLRGYNDDFLLDGQPRSFRPLWYRTFRYLQIEVEAGAEPVQVKGLTNLFRAYPFREQGRFASSDASLGKIWEVGWRTARLCAHETYMDCPYYEQLQYGGDTRIQCLVSLYVGGDDRLVRNAIAQLDDSRMPDGITASRYPSHLQQIIPPFALWWIGMIHDYWMLRDDPAYIKRVLPGARATLEWFINHLEEKELLGPLPWWNFVDWARVFRDGVPPGAAEGGSSILSLQLVLALRETAEMERALGVPSNAERYDALADRIRKAVKRECWDKERGLLADTPERKRFSQHANVLGILADVLTGREAAGVAKRIQTDPPDNLAQATFYFRFYLHRALRKAGLGESYLDWLKPWYQMLDVGLTTWAENPEPTRSDCHAWSAHPNVDLLATVLGVESGAPGFSKVLITPHLGRLEWAEGVVPHPRGEVSVKLRREGGKLRAEIALPEGVEGVLRYGGHETPLKAGAQTVTI